MTRMGGWPGKRTRWDAAWRDVSPPTGWTWGLPFTIQQRGYQFRPAPSWNILAYAPTGKAYYVAPSGNDANDGLTLGTALRTVKAAILKADVDVIYLAAGHYNWTYGWFTATPSRSIAFYALSPGDVIISTSMDFSWALDLFYTNTYKATAASYVGWVFDASVLDGLGDYQELTARADVATVDANPGSYFWDNVGLILYVRLGDDRAPDADVRAYRQYSSMKCTTDNITLYFQDIKFEGGDYTVYFKNASAAGGLNVYALNCSFKYGVAGCCYIHGGAAILQNCVAARSKNQDGFNYHINLTVVPKVIEIDCVGRNNGGDDLDDFDNGSSMHDGGEIVRIMGEYYGNVGNNVWDVTSTTKSWNLGSVSHRSAGVANRANFAIGIAGGGGRMWLDRVVSHSSVTDLSEDANAILYTRSCKTQGVFVGTPTEY